ncbi:O-antigen ligase family protein [Ollibium composti]|uniref:O-antigen ligase family protein n=1 Tax=Ollibium composti TaxID=2675109 RepID=A0ABY2Q7G5_9HYPH|nr:O-antigen ligase family protein [Mesorhizobium composti]THF56591.1 O-antigen ligase family protein [Mesorhizobium composti]
MRFAARNFLLRRRVDRWILFAAGVAQAVRFGMSGLVTFVFSCIGFYLWVARHKSARYFDQPFLWLALCYVAWSCGLILLRSHHPLQDRQMGYSLLCGFFAFSGAGMVLITDPLRSFVVGSRIGIAGAFAVGLGYALFDPIRQGMGGNEAVFAFTAAVSTLVATIPVKNPPRWAPNCPFYLIAGCFAVMFSETRAVYVPLLFFALVEIAWAILTLPRRSKSIALIAALAGMVLLAVLPVTQQNLVARIDPWVDYMTSNKSSEQDGISESDMIRGYLWVGAVKVIAAHPIVGVGSEAKMQAIVAMQSSSAEQQILEPFIHTHNAVLDELLNDGAVGLLIVIGLFGSIAGCLWRGCTRCVEKRNLVYFFLIFLSYGMFHNPLLHEMTIATIFLYLGVLHATVARRRRERGMC